MRHAPASSRRARGAGRHHESGPPSRDLSMWLGGAHTPTCVLRNRCSTQAPRQHITRCSPVRAAGPQGSGLGFRGQTSTLTLTQQAWCAFVQAASGHGLGVRGQTLTHTQQARGVLVRAATEGREAGPMTSGGSAVSQQGVSPTTSQHSLGVAEVTPSPHTTPTSQQQAFRRQARQLLTKSSGSGTATAPSTASPTKGSRRSGRRLAPNTASAAVAVVEAVQPTVVHGSSNNILAASFYSGPQQHRALVLDSSYRPINVVPWNRAVTLDVNNGAEVIEYYEWPAVAISGRGEHPMPAVLKVKTHLNLDELASRVACTRRNVMIRDKFCCQYCGIRRDLTLDHVMPQSKGGKDTWTNLVTACTACNQRKASHLLGSAHLLGWRLKQEPREPKPYEIGVCVGLGSGDLMHPPAVWEPYIEHYRERLRNIRRMAREVGADLYSSDEEDHDPRDNVKATK